MTEVVAALIWHGDRFLICQRPAHKQRGLLWEFVGGKVEPGETRQEALIRECQEELDITLDVGDVFYEVEHNDIRWITVGEMGDYAFCPADTEILAQIRARCPAGGADHG